MSNSLHPELTPVDLYAAGYVIREHRISGWCWWKVRDCGGQSYGAQWATVEEAIEDARWLMGARTGQQMLLGEE
jgi:hypothetical protein